MFLSVLYKISYVPLTEVPDLSTEDIKKKPIYINLNLQEAIDILSKNDIECIFCAVNRLTYSRFNQFKPHARVLN